MKSLKFDHHLVQLIIAGKKTTTWRLYDDKDLAVNDDIRIIDIVDPNYPETWQAVGVARINSIIQKRIGDVTSEDYEGNGDVLTQEDLLRLYRKHYGSQVDLETPVKIIRFVFNNKKLIKEDIDEIYTTKLTEVKLYVDGGSRGNPGPSASGFVILDYNNHVVVRKSIYLGITTNNQAEYQALKFGLIESQRMGVKVIHVYMDSLLVVNQMLGVFKVKNRDLWPIHESVKELVSHFNHVDFTHIPRELNKLADAAVNDALDLEDKQQ